MESTAQDSHFLHLPPEIMEIILTNPVLDDLDWCNLRLSCRRLSDILINNDCLWREKFRLSLRYKGSYKLVEKIKSDRSNQEEKEEDSWMSFFKQRIAVKKLMAEKLRHIARTSYKGLADYEMAKGETHYYSFVCPSHGFRIDNDVWFPFVIDEMTEVCTSGSSHENMVAKFYAMKCLWYLRHLDQLPQIQCFVSMDESIRDIEVGAAILSQWMQPSQVITSSDIKQGFDRLTDTVRRALASASPLHPLFTQKVEVDPNLTESLWSPTECRQILQAIESVMKPTFNQNQDQFDYYDPENSYMNMVLLKKKGIPITLCLTTICVAKRLGMVLEPVSFPHHFLLRWLAYPTKAGLEKYSFIDPFHGNYFMSYQSLEESYDSRRGPVTLEIYGRCTNQEISQRMLRNLINIGKQDQSNKGLNLFRYSVELYNLFNPQDLEMMVLYVQICLHLKVNLPSIISKIQDISTERPGWHGVLIDLQEECEQALVNLQLLHREAEKADPVVKLRDNYKTVKFAVGMVMKHRKYNYYCVIYGWDDTCKAGERWIKQMGVDKCQRGRHQPFYHVWVEDGTDRYAAEENLEIVRGKVIDHPEVGRLFNSFNNMYYTPGNELKEEYPQDESAASEMIAEFLERSSSLQ